MNVEVNGQTVYYKVSGEGERTVVILQGWAAPCGLYDSFAVALADRYRVVQLDLPGFGRSDDPGEPWDVGTYVEFLRAFMRTLGIASATLVGHSYGGRIVLKLASDPNERLGIERIVLVDAAGIPRRRTRVENVRIAWFRLVRRITSIPIVHASFPDLIDDWLGRQGSQDYRDASPVMKATMVRSISEDLTPCLPHVRQETLLIWGADDDATPLADGQLMEREMPSATLVSIDGAGHFPFLDQPSAFFPILSAFLDEEATGAGGSGVTGDSEASRVGPGPAPTLPCADVGASGMTVASATPHTGGERGS